MICLYQKPTITFKVFFNPFSPGFFSALLVPTSLSATGHKEVIWPGFVWRELGVNNAGMHWLNSPVQKIVFKAGYNPFMPRCSELRECGQLENTDLFKCKSRGWMYHNERIFVDNNGSQNLWFQTIPPIQCISMEITKQSWIFSSHDVELLWMLPGRKGLISIFIPQCPIAN